MEELYQKATTRKNVQERRSLEALLRSVTKRHGFMLVDFSPYEHHTAYSLYDEKSIEYETMTDRNGAGAIVKTYPVAARMLLGNEKNRAFYVDEGEVLMYCADDYYKDIFGE